MSQAEPSRARRVLKKAFFAGLSLAIIVLATEVVVRVVYAVRWPKSRLERTPIHWTVTGNTKYTAKLAYVKNPWNQHKQIIRNDSLLYWSFKKAVQRRFLDITAPQARRDGPVEKLEVVEVRTNRRGFRGADFYETKTPGTFRIACLGDSYTFGFSVDQEDTYPLRLQGLFNLRFPEKRFEVLNCGVYGYSSHQGLKLLTERVLAFEPDVLILGFGVNDSSTTLRPESDARYDRSFLRRVTYVLDESEAWKIYKFLLIKAAGAVGGAGGQREGKPWEPRVSVGEYAANLQAMIRAARDRGIVPLLICPYPMTFRASPYFMALSGVAAQERVTLIDPWPNLNRKQRALWAGVESALGLAPSDTSVLDEPRGAGPGFEPDGAAFPCVVRVYFGPHEEGPKEKVEALVQTIPFAIPGAGPSMARLALNDAGKDGDERPGDRVFSATFSVRPMSGLIYFFVNGDAGAAAAPGGGVRNVFEDLSYLSLPGGDAPPLHMHFVTGAPESGTLTLPVMTFGESYLSKDVGHFNATANEAIAEAAFQTAVSLAGVQAYLEGR